MMCGWEREPDRRNNKRTEERKGERRRAEEENQVKNGRDVKGEGGK